MFVGEYNHNIDPKGRVIFPAEYRETMGEKIYITLWFDGCLAAYDEAAWKVLEEKLCSLSVTDPKARMLQRTLLSKVQEASFDKQGRVLIKESLRNFAGLTKDVTLIGVGTRIEIWDAEKYSQMQTFDLESAAEQLGELGFRL